MRVIVSSKEEKEDCTLNGAYLLVMPMMRMLLRLSTPSILDSSWFTIESATPVLSLNTHIYKYTNRTSYFETSANTL